MRSKNCNKSWILPSLGGCEVKVWDAIAGRLLSKISQHHKTVTCLALASDNKRLLSGSLDRHIKIYDVDTYSVVHTLDYPAPVLCMAVAVSMFVYMCSPSHSIQDWSLP